MQEMSVEKDELHQDDMKNKGWIDPIRQIILVENSQCDKEMNQFSRPNSSDDLCLLFCINPLLCKTHFILSHTIKS